MVETTKIFGATIQRQKERGRETETETKRQRERDRETKRQRQREEQRQRETERAVLRDYRTFPRNYPRRRTVLKLQRDFQRDCYEQLP